MDIVIPNFPKVLVFIEIIPELLKLFIRTQNSFNLEVLELFQRKAELRVLFGLDIENPNFPKVLLFSEILPELLKVKEFCFSELRIPSLLEVLEVIQW